MVKNLEQKVQLHLGTLLKQTYQMAADPNLQDEPVIKALNIYYKVMTIF